MFPQAEHCTSLSSPFDTLNIAWEIQLPQLWQVTLEIFANSILRYDVISVNVPTVDLGLLLLLFWFMLIEGDRPSILSTFTFENKSPEIMNFSDIDTKKIAYTNILAI